MTRQPPTIAIASRAFWPFFHGGGIARYTRATAALLAPVADVTVLLPDFYEGKVDPGDPRLPRGARLFFVPEPNRSDPAPFASLYHAWSANVREALLQLYPDGPDLVELNDFTGEGAVTVQAKRSGDPRLARTRILLGIHGTDEIHRLHNGQSLEEPEPAAIASLERVALAGADVIFTPGGDVRGTYERFYGPAALAPARTQPHPFAIDDGQALPRRSGDGPLRLLHVGRYERRKGVAELIGAVRLLDRDDVALTLMGRDTPTGPGSTSMRSHCERLARGDRRIEFHDHADHEEVMRTLADHDVVVVPSRWETNANVAREALMVARPVLATPTGGLTRIVDHGVNGWLAAGVASEDIAAAIERLLDDREAVERLVGTAELRASLERSVQNEAAREAYLEEAGDTAAAPGPPPALAARVVDGDGDALERTLESIAAQSAPPRGTEVVPTDLATGVVPSPADVPLAVLPAGAELDPRFFARCAHAFAAAPDAAYVTTWTDATEPWQARPLGNAVPLVEREDCGGAVLIVHQRHARRALEHVTATELAGGGAWLLARELRAEGEHGVVVPEELARLRGVPGRTQAAARRVEVEAALARERTDWLAPAPASALGT